MFTEDLLQAYIPPARAKSSRIVKKPTSTTTKRQPLRPCEPMFKVFGDSSSKDTAVEPKISMTLKTPFYDGKENMDPNLMREPWTLSIAPTLPRKSTRISTKLDQRTSSSHPRSTKTTSSSQRSSQCVEIKREVKVAAAHQDTENLAGLKTSVQQYSIYGDSDKSKSVLSRSLKPLLQQVA